jgi:hypothetical protein
MCFRMVLGWLKIPHPKSAWNFLTSTKETSIDDIKNYFGESVNVNFFKSSKFIRDEFKEDKRSWLPTTIQKDT